MRISLTMLWSVRRREMWADKTNYSDVLVKHWWTNVPNLLRIFEGQLAFTPFRP